VNTLSALSHEQKIASKVVNDAIKKYKIDPEKPYPIKL
jgi:pyruvate dehydrogenase E1 component